MNKYHWSPEERATLIAMRADGKTIQEVSDAIGRSKKAISNYIRRHGLKCRGRLPNRPKPETPPESVVASAALREACSIFMLASHEQRRLTFDEQLALVAAGKAKVRPKHPTRHSDRTGHRPSEIIARPIGEIIKPIVARVMEQQG